MFSLGFWLGRKAGFLCASALRSFPSFNVYPPLSCFHFGFWLPPFPFCLFRARPLFSDSWRLTSLFRAALPGLFSAGPRSPLALLFPLVRAGPGASSFPAVLWFLPRRAAMTLKLPVLLSCGFHAMCLDPRRLARAFLRRLCFGFGLVPCFGWAALLAVRPSWLCGHVGFWPALALLRASCFRCLAFC